MQGEVAGRGSFRGAGRWVLAASSVAMLMLGAASAKAEPAVLSPHVATPQTVTPHLVESVPTAPPVAVADPPAVASPTTDSAESPEPAAPPRLAPSHSNGVPVTAAGELEPTAVGPAAADDSSPAYVQQCPSSDVSCNPLPPGKLKEREEQARAETLAKEIAMKELLEKYLRLHPPKVMDLYTGQLLCPLDGKVWTYLTARSLEALAANLGPGNFLSAEVRFLGSATASKGSCLNTVRQ